MILELHPPDAGCGDGVERDVRVCSLRRRIAVSVGGAIAVAGLLVYVLAGRGSQFSAALRTAPLTLVGLSLLLQIGALLTRTEAWAICVRAAGGTVSRRVLFRSAAFGCVASIVNGSVGMAVRIASVRRAAPLTTPRAPALVAAELPIITVELALVALFSFTLVAPLGLPLWVPAIIIMLMIGLVALLRRVSDRHRTGLGAGLAVLHTQSRGRLVTFALLAVCAQVLRNWLMLHAVGVHVSIFDSMALLIVMFTVGQLPIGPSTGPAATVLILGAHGVAAAAAAGVLLTLTGIIGSLIFAAWAATDSIASRRRAVAAPPEALAVLTRPVVAPQT
ncbi:MAG: lysylphosphatidylglycerol synthase domain-containing protein [Solirubrobacteraceae bacterium]